MAIRVAIVGVGKVASGNYLPYLSERDDIDLAYLNRTTEKATAAAERFGGTVLEGVSALAEWRPDIAMVLTKETDRFGVGIDVVKASPKDIFFEKPLVAQSGQAHVSEEDFELGRRLLRDAASNGCRTAMMFNYRFFDQSVRAKKLIDERNFGSLVSASGVVHYACWSHCIDLVHYFGGPLESVTALRTTRVSKGAGIVAPDLSASFITAAGASGTLIGTAGLAWQHPLFELTLVFEGGRIHLRDLDGELELLDGSSDVHERIAVARHTSRWQAYSASFRKALQAYLDAVLEDHAPPVTGEDGLRELQVEAAIRRSITESRPIRLAEELPL